MGYSINWPTFIVPWAPNRLVDSKTPKHIDFDQFWKFKFHFEHFPRTHNFLVLTDPLIYLYLFQNHRQTFSWLGERPSSHLKVSKMWFGPNIKYLLEPFFADFCCCISCFLACFTCIDPIIVTISFLMLIQKVRQTIDFCLFFYNKITFMVCYGWVSNLG